MTQKIAFVTGSSRGIGKGIAIQLAKAGYDLGIHYSTTPDGAMDTKAQIEAIGRRACVYRADIRQLDQIQAMFQAFFQDFDHIDLMVNNAGVTRMKPFLEIGPDMFEEVINTDLRGSFFCAQAAARNMVDKQVHGVIINIASNHAIGCWPGSTVYAAAKAGLEKMGKNMAMELSKYGIRVVTVAPGYTLLPERNWTQSEEGKKSMERTCSRIPIHRFATPTEIGDAVVFLSSEKAGYITGTTLYIDGGSLLPVLAQNEFE